MKYLTLLAILLSFTFLSCGEKSDTAQSGEKEITFENKGHEIVYNMVQKVGNYSMLAKKKDVVYNYNYETPDGEADNSTEKYIFNGELSYGLFDRHERTFPDLEGSIEQGYDGNEFWLKNQGEIVTDTNKLKRVAFSRPTNFYWFTMFQKLLDPGLKYEYLGEKVLINKTYDIVKISFVSQDDKPTDIYQLYVNKKTGLVDQFLFTVADYGKMEIPFLMQLKYETIDGMMIPTKRQYKKSTWNADLSHEQWTKVNWTNIKFNNGLKKDVFKKESLGFYYRQEIKN
jgi:hypothetical protein